LEIFVSQQKKIIQEMSQAMNTRVQSVALLRSIFFPLLQAVWCANSSCVPCQSYAVEVAYAGPADCEEREADERENSGRCRTTGIAGGHPLGWLQSCFPNAKVVYESHTEESTEECMEYKECPETESACIAEVSDHIPAEDRNAVETIVFMPECKENRLHFGLRHGRKDFGKVTLSPSGEHYQEVEEAPEQCYDYRARSVPEWIYILPVIIVGVLCIIGCCTICGVATCTGCFFTAFIEIRKFSKKRSKQLTNFNNNHSLTLWARPPWPGNI
jgi:hypothetical protein